MKITKTQVLSAVAAASIVATPMVAKWEGKSNTPYADIVGVQTVCYGETRVAMRKYTDAECTAMLDKAVKEFITEVVTMTPTLEKKPNALAAASSTAYNIGLGNYKTSSARKRFLEGKIASGCANLKLFNKARVKGKLIPVKGLINRREDEYKTCMKDA